uniref:Uncharacterized protein n=1 Tax=Romanomermis culicivorax TaxID=13658 RepID=A0A915KRY9_ROMCU
MENYCSCAKEKYTESCNHNAKQGALYGTRVTSEIYKSLLRGQVCSPAPKPSMCMYGPWTFHRGRWAW